MTHALFRSGERAKEAEMAPGGTLVVSGCFFIAWQEGCRPRSLLEALG